MNQNKVNVMLHPVRMRIIQILMGNKELTVQQMSERLSNIPQATMYRHLNKLLAADIIKVVDENQIRGTVEKVYSLNQNINRMTKQDMERATGEEHFKYFFTFMLNLLGDYEKYLSQESYDVVNDGVAFRQASIYVSDDEFIHLVKEVNNALLKVIENKPNENRKLKTIATIIIPEGTNK